MRLFDERVDTISIGLKSPEAARGLHRCDGREGSLLAVELDKLRDVEIRDAIAVREAEVLVAEIRQDALKASSGHRLLARVDERDAPWLRSGLVDLDPAGARSNVTSLACR